MSLKYLLKQAVICMSDNINSMNFKQLRTEVQMLRDELAIMKRKYEDIIYNLDTDNFSSRFVKEQGDMKTAIKVTAEGIETKVSKEEFESEFNIYADGLYATVSRTYETKADAASAYGALHSSISSVSVEADNISTRVDDLETFKSSTFTQTADGFLLDGEKSGFTGYIYLTDNDGNKAFTLFHDETGFGFPAFVLWGVGDYENDPIVLGSTESKLYIGHPSENYEVATKSWVRDNAGSGGGGTVVAVFG